MAEYARLRSWFTYDPSAPGRVPLDDAEVQRLVRRVAPGSTAVDLGGWASLNLLLEPTRLVVRVHRPFVSRRHLVVAQLVRERLAAAGLTVPVAVRWQRSTVLRCGRHFAELEPWLAHERLPPSLPSYDWLFGALGELHRAMATVQVAVPRPVLASYTPPSTLRRWLTATRAAVAGDADATEVVDELANLVRGVARHWVPSTRLPRQLVHGDIHLANVGQAPGGEPVYMDFGNMSLAPRVHDLAYALVHMVFALNDYRKADAQGFPWHAVPDLVRSYETAAGWSLTELERQALVPYIAAVPIHYATRAGFFADPAAMLHEERPFLELSRWLLARSVTVAGDRSDIRSRGGTGRGAADARGRVRRVRLG